jgi:N-carbamoyl-L-amino-acid hydrolase
MNKQLVTGSIKVNGKRLIKNIQELGKIGMNDEGGIDRALGSEADREARQWLIQYWESRFKIATRIDPIANLWLEQTGSEDLLPIVIGSHHDAVPNGGIYDGPLGVLMATELMETLKEKGIKLRHPLFLISFTGEEPNPFNISTLGSKVVTGRLSKNDLEQFSHRDTGVSLKEAIKNLGGNLDQVEEALLKKGDIKVFLECHIEQGDRLEKMDLSLSTVSCITGIYREKITVVGEANHAGTTGMTNRKDAFLAGAELSLGIEAIILALDNGEVAGTVGYVKVKPNEANIISETATLIMDLRVSDNEIKEKIRFQIKKLATDIENRRGVTINREIILDQPPRPMSETVMNALDNGIDSIGEPKQHLISMAGHDAANISLVADTGMIFVKSVNGKSHCKEEYSEPQDIEKCANAMMAALLLLDKELD